MIAIPKKQRKQKKFGYNLIPKTKLFSAILVYLGLFGVFCTTSAFADGGDLLKDALVDIKANFGLSSVFIKALYLMEIYYGWRKYRETHNPFAVGSIVLVAMALTYAIGKWVGA